MNIYESIAAIMGEGYAIGKNKRNEQQKFLYRGIDDVMNTFQPLLSKYKVFVVPMVLDQHREERTGKSGGNLIYSVLTIQYTFYAEDGSSVSAVVIGEGMDSGDKSSNKAMAIGMKYAMFQVFCIPTEEMADPDASTPEPSVPGEEQIPRALNLKTCADCGHVILGITKNGKVLRTPDDIAKSTEEKYGRPLCVECGKKAEQNAGQGG